MRAIFYACRRTLSILHFAFTKPSIAGGIFNASIKEFNMCGCMPNHASMDHGQGDHQPMQQTVTSAAAAAQGMPGRKCAHCGFPLQDDYDFCPGCGMNLQTVKCPACGQMVVASLVSCPHCGSPLGEI
jgi:RNA polymerase subunit RPABC4/transcription elongation factor Spt4